MKLKFHFALIPAQLPKPLQPFQGITLDDQINIPSLNGSSAQKLRLDVKRGEHRGENNWVHITATSYLLFPCFCFFFPWKKRQVRRTDSFLFDGLLFGEHDISIYGFEAVVGIFECFNKWPCLHKLLMLGYTKSLYLQWAAC